MRAIDNTKQVLLTQASVTRNGLRGSASSIVNRFVSNAVGLLLSVGALSPFGWVVVVVATVLPSLELGRLNATELTRGSLRVHFSLMM